MNQRAEGGGVLGERVENGFLHSRIFREPLMHYPAAVLLSGGADQIDGGALRRKTGGFDVEKEKIFFFSENGTDYLLILC